MATTYADISINIISFTKNILYENHSFFGYSIRHFKSTRRAVNRYGKSPSHFHWIYISDWCE